MIHTTRDRRLANEYHQLKEFLCRKKHITVAVVDGDPPDYYQLSFNTRGIIRLENGNPVYGSAYLIEFILPAEYPRDAPMLRCLTPIFHPNFYKDGSICISMWIPGRTLVTLIQQLDDMICYRNFDTHFIDNAPNEEAAQWAVDHPQLIPISSITRG